MGAKDVEAQLLNAVRIPLRPITSMLTEAYFLSLEQERPGGQNILEEIESRHHSVVTIDYKGQGYFAPPGKWISLVDNEHATFGVCDSKYAYDWYFHPTLSGFADKNKSRRKYARWSRFVEDTDLWLKDNPRF